MPIAGAPAEGSAASGPSDRPVVLTACLGALGLLAVLAWRAPADRLLLFILGMGLGMSLCHAGFGFSGGWRRCVLERRTLGLRAQLLVLALTSIAFVPLLTWHGGLAGAVAPVGVALVVGAFLFGVGMALAGGCGSGTLFLTGAGKPRMFIVLVAFIVGSVIGSLHLPWWLQTPGLPAISLAREFGSQPALALQLAVLAGLGAALSALERRRHGEAHALFGVGPSRPRLTAAVTGPWPLLWGAVALAGLGAAVLWVAGAPWGITFGFSLWGAEALTALGVDMTQFEYWRWAYPRQGLAQGVWVNATSVTDLGLLLGAFLAAGLGGQFRANAAQRPGLAASASAIAAGLAMGYGARLAFGCNIGAMLGGIASASLHGWIWFAMAFLGFWVTLWVRRTLLAASAGMG